jgi:hypothetical protein
VEDDGEDVDFMHECGTFSRALAYSRLTPDPCQLMFAAAQAPALPAGIFLTSPTTPINLPKVSLVSHLFSLTVSAYVTAIRECRRSTSLWRG